MKRLFVSILIFSASGPSVWANQLSEKHAKLGIECQACHINNNAVLVEDEACLVCHGPISKLVASTHRDRKPHDTAVSPNPHNSAHYGTTLSCFTCHSEHKQSEIYCHQCHAFKYKSL
ncbi:cytochrome c3 family protein [Shewanella algae]